MSSGGSSESGPRDNPRGRGPAGATASSVSSGGSSKSSPRDNFLEHERQLRLQVRREYEARKEYEAESNRINEVLRTWVDETWMERELKARRAGRGEEVPVQGGPSGIPAEETAGYDQREPKFACPACGKPLTEIWTTDCGHVCCRSCFESSIQESQTCPLCFGKVTPRDIHRVYLPPTI